MKNTTGTPIIRMRNAEFVEQFLQPEGSSLGFGHFTSFRAYRFSSTTFGVVGFDRHCTRLIAGTAQLQDQRVALPPASDIECMVREVLDRCARQFEEGDARVRCTVWPGSFDIEASTVPSYAPLYEPVALMPYEGERILPEIKSCSAALSVVAEAASIQAGFYGSLLVKEGTVREGGWGNFIWVSRDGVVVYTTTKVLAGIAQDTIIDLLSQDLQFSSMKVENRTSTLEEIHATATEAFLCNGVRWVIPVGQLGTKNIGKSQHQAGPLTASLIALNETLQVQDSLLGVQVTRFGE